MIPFVKTLWCKPDRFEKVTEDIKKQLKHKYQIDYTCLTYGEENHKKLTDMGIKSICICPHDRLFLPTSEFGHKIHAWKEAALMFKKFIFLDHDVYLTRPLPEDFYDYYEGKIFEANLRQYFNPKVKRKPHQRKLPCASFVYFGNPNIPMEIDEIWRTEFNKGWREESPMRYWVDKQCGGNLDLDYYLKNFEPKYFCLKNSSVFRDRDKDTLFIHVSRKRRD